MNNAEIEPRLNVKCGFNPDGIKRKINSIGLGKQKAIYGWTLFDELVKSPI
jgi:hypothetical protein